MSSRSARRNGHKRLARALKAAEASHSPLACRWLEHWRAEANRRARRLGAPAAWGLLTELQVVRLLRQLDSTGELAADLSRICAEAVARYSDPRLVSGCRPLSKPVKQKR